MSHHATTSHSIRHSTFGLRNSTRLALRGIETLSWAKSRGFNRGMKHVKTHRARGKKWPCASTFGPEHADTFRDDFDPDFGVCTSHN